MVLVTVCCTYLCIKCAADAYFAEMTKEVSTQTPRHCLLSALRVCLYLRSHNSYNELRRENFISVIMTTQ